MTELILERNERLRLRADAHHLNPLVLIGEKGMTPAVLKEIERALDDHGLVKVHVAGDDREERPHPGNRQDARLLSSSR